MSRRAAVQGAAWSVPVVLWASATPAVAASNGPVVLSAPNGQVPASDAVSVTASVKNSAGAPVSGAAVSFSGPSGASFNPSTATTNSSGVASTSLQLGTPWAKPGSSAVVNAVSSAGSKSQSFTVTGSNLLIGGSWYSSSGDLSEVPLMQTEQVFPSPVVDAMAMNSSTWFMVLLANGTVWTKGYNNYGQMGNGTGGTSNDRQWAWGQVPGISGVTQIAGGIATAYALLSDGSVKAWGYNGNGHCGDGTTVNRLSPVQVSGLTSGVTYIAAGLGTGYALLSDGSVKAWGYNAYAQMGNGQQSDTNVTPTQVSGLTSGVTQLAAAGQSGYALLSDGSVKAWGSNYYGQIGDGTKNRAMTPTQVKGLTSGVTHVTAGLGTGYALMTDGSLKVWGLNDVGQFGDGTTTDQYVPAQTPGFSGVKQIAAGASTTYALLSDGSVKASGANRYSQVGDGTTTNRPTPVTLTMPSGRAVQRLATNTNYSWSAFITLKTT